MNSVSFFQKVYSKPNRFLYTAVPPKLDHSLFFHLMAHRMNICTYYSNILKLDNDTEL